jgi:hypothetical protein
MEDELVAMEDVCTTNFAMFGEDGWQLECKDPDYGGL